MVLELSAKLLASITWLKGTRRNSGPPRKRKLAVRWRSTTATSGTTSVFGPSPIRIRQAASNYYPLHLHSGYCVVQLQFPSSFCCSCFAIRPLGCPFPRHTIFHTYSRTSRTEWGRSFHVGNRYSLRLRVQGPILIYSLTYAQGCKCSFFNGTEFSSSSKKNKWNCWNFSSSSSISINKITEKWQLSSFQELKNGRTFTTLVMQYTRYRYTDTA